MCIRVYLFSIKIIIIYVPIYFFKINHYKVVLMDTVSKKLFYVRSFALCQIFYWLYRVWN